MGSMKGDINNLPSEIYGKSLCLFGEDTILAIGFIHCSQSITQELFWFSVEEDSEQQTLSITSETLPINQVNGIVLNRILACFVNEQSYYVLGVDNRSSEKLFEFNLSTINFKEIESNLVDRSSRLQESPNENQWH